MPYSVKRLFKINKDVIEVLLMLEVPLAQYPKIEDLFCRTATWSETCLFSSAVIVSAFLTVPSAGLYLRGILGWSCSGSCTIEGCLSWEGDDKRLGPWYGSLACLPYLIADFIQGTYHGISSRLYQLPRDIVYPCRISLVEWFLSCFDLFQQDWVVISVGYWWDIQHLRVTYDFVAVLFCTVLDITLLFFVKWHTSYSWPTLSKTLERNSKMKLVWR